ncbi:MAG: DUF2267 domain-containing protein [Chloroflexi bacterium]|nr:MAG: DUF2267 domain-containing protein [Chloroflexota bacterium]
MDQLINMISERTGISEDQARQATEMVIGFLKDRLPAPIASQLDNVMSGQAAGNPTDQSKKGLGGLGDLFG